jgi:hypothetical protein
MDYRLLFSIFHKDRNYGAEKLKNKNEENPCSVLGLSPVWKIAISSVLISTDFTFDNAVFTGSEVNIQPHVLTTHLHHVTPTAEVYFRCGILGWFSFKLLMFCSLSVTHVIHVYLPMERPFSVSSHSTHYVRI